MKEYKSVPLYKRHMCTVQVSICSTIICAIQVIWLGLKPITLYTLIAPLKLKVDVRPT